MNSRPKLWHLILFLVISIGLTFYQAFVFETIYNWFIPLATGWTPISYWLAFGISLFISFVRYRHVKDTRETISEYVESIALNVFVPAFFLGASALINIGIYYGGV